MIATKEKYFENLRKKFKSGSKKIYQCCIVLMSSAPDGRCFHAAWAVSKSVH